MTLIDTDILIDSSRGVQEAIDCLKKVGANSSLDISVITEMELVIGCRNKNELSKLNKFLKPFQIIALDATISDKSVELLRLYRLSHNLQIPDSLIAALTLNLPLISKNQRDYRFIAGLNLLPYP